MDGWMDGWVKATKSRMVDEGGEGIQRRSESLGYTCTQRGRHERNTFAYIRCGKRCIVE